MKFSLVIIAHNEAHRIEKLLKNIRYADEVLVVDSFSEDGTAALCERYGARVLNREFPGFGEQKQFAVDQSKNDWVLSLDADEVPDAACWEHIRSLMEAEEPDIKAWYITRRLVFMGREFRFGKEAKDRQLRFFHRKHAHWTTPPVHEQVISDGPTAKLKGKVAHESYSSLDNYFGKFNRYTRMAADDLIQRGKKRARWARVLGVPVNFFKYYILEVNILNGYAGFCWSLFSSIYTLVKYSKSEE